MIILYGCSEKNPVSNDENESISPGIPVPMLMYPLDKDTSFSDIVTLTWETADSTLQSHLQIDTTEIFENPVFSKIIHVSDYGLPDSLLPDSGWMNHYKLEDTLEDDVYFWRVRCLDSTGTYGFWSEIQCFALLKTGISGTITFLGDWPGSTKEIRLIISKYFYGNISDPDSQVSSVIEGFLNGEIIFGEQADLFCDTYDYHIELEPDLYEWISVFWFPDEPNYILLMKEIGRYSTTQGEENLPAAIDLRNGGYLTGININADFNHINNENLLL